ncbi:hypothetical protein TL16_g01111 [Triparma laevis f. inornata]|uniref:BspA family leucine-rich repeat surface protein n=1 Tax=Triparma laevis f. inornata TaxID=1714386 RepID=A0A9W6ZKX8_9STRA|nr:hypothetical protein TL16_g01111 [Triparma laevis f. inornata]
MPPINEVLLEDCIGYVVSFLKADKCELWNVAQLSRGFLLGAKLRLSQFLKRSNSDIHQAVQLWCKSKNKKKAEIEYGHISEWDVSYVTNMACLFQGRRDFNEDLSKWNVSNVKNMGGMFWGCIHFNNDSLSNWNVGSVKKMQYMFARADAFNGDITRWNTENVEDMQYMFGVSKSFNQDLSNWNVEKCKNMMEMFRQAYIFSSDLSSWNVHNVTSMFAMFYRATSFNNDTIKNWDLASIKKGHRPTRKCAKNSPTMIQQR